MANSKKLALFLCCSVTFGENRQCSQAARQCRATFPHLFWPFFAASVGFPLPCESYSIDRAPTWLPDHQKISPTSPQHSSPTSNVEIVIILSGHCQQCIVMESCHSECIEKGRMPWTVNISHFRYTFGSKCCWCTNSTTVWSEKRSIASLQIKIKLFLYIQYIFLGTLCQTMDL